MKSGLFVLLVAAGVACGLGAVVDITPVTEPVLAESSPQKLWNLQAIKAASVPACLSDFKSTGSWLTDDGPLPVRWSSQRALGLETAEECRAAWESKAVYGEADWEGVLLQYSGDEQDGLRVKTCRQWVDGRRTGRYAVTQADMSVESYFIAADGVLSAIAHAAPSTQTAFAPIDLRTLAYMLLPPPFDTDQITRSNPPELAWSIEGNTIRREDEWFFEWIEPVVFGDMDGDGWEDMVAMYGMGSRQGSMRVYSMRAFTRRGAAPLIEITPRLPDSMPDVTERQRDIAHWLGNCGLPSDQPIELYGRCGCGDVEHDLWMEITARQGILSGTYRCERQPDGSRLNGCIVDEFGILTEFGIDSAPTANLSFDWFVTNGDLCIVGHRCGAGTPWVDEFFAEGRVVQPLPR
jgi:hypothetical protein